MAVNYLTALLECLFMTSIINQNKKARHLPRFLTLFNLQNALLSALVLDALRKAAFL